MEVLKGNIAKYVWLFTIFPATLPQFSTNLTESRVTIVENLEKNIEIFCRFDEKIGPEFWVINGSIYDLYTDSIPYIEHVRLYVLRIPTAVLCLNNTTFQCLSSVIHPPGRVKRVYVIRARSTSTPLSHRSSPAVMFDEEEEEEQWERFCNDANEVLAGGGGESSDGGGSGSGRNGSNDGEGNSSASSSSSRGSSSNSSSSVAVAIGRGGRRGRGRGRGRGSGGGSSRGGTSSGGGASGTGGASGRGGDSGGDGASSRGGASDSSGDGVSGGGGASGSSRGGISGGEASGSSTVGTSGGGEDFQSQPRRRDPFPYHHNYECNEQNTPDILLNIKTTTFSNKDKNTSFDLISPSDCEKCEVYLEVYETINSAARNMIPLNYCMAHVPSAKILSNGNDIYFLRITASMNCSSRNIYYTFNDVVTEENVVMRNESICYPYPENTAMCDFNNTLIRLRIADNCDIVIDPIVESLRNFSCYSNFKSFMVKVDYENRNVCLSDWDTDINDTVVHFLCTTSCPDYSCSVYNFVSSHSIIIIVPNSTRGFPWTRPYSTMDQIKSCTIIIIIIILSIVAIGLVIHKICVYLCKKWISTEEKKI